VRPQESDVNLRHNQVRIISRVVDEGYPILLGSLE
jgi:hypothetical protein